jgi:hypothetical protein
VWRHLGCELVHYGELPTTLLRCRQRSGHKEVLCCRILGQSLLYHSFFRRLSLFRFVSTQGLDACPFLFHLVNQQYDLL